MTNDPDLITPEHEEPTMTPNHAELDALLAWAEGEHDKEVQGLPSEWDQGTWAASRTNLQPSAQSPSCGTACCIAGKAVARQGGVFLLEQPFAGATRLRADYAEMPNGRRVMIETEAEEILGLTRVQADALFDADNTIASIRRIVQEIKDGVEEPEAGPVDGEWPDDEDEDY